MTEREPATPIPAVKADAASDRAVRRFWLGTVLLLPVTAVLLFFIAGTVRWPGAWIYLAVSWVASIAGGFLIPRELAAERGTIPKDMASYDKVIAPLLARGLPLVTFVVAGLDQRFGWSPSLELIWPVLGFAGVFFGAGILDWAMATNVFFSGVMRIQSERGHHVVDSGPYARVRHPGYTGLALHNLGMPFLLGSLWALIPSLAIVAVTVLRTELEDRALREELEGYPAYASRVRFRLVPGVW
jgi:protein-S-isoprenylcysteine O-methyltransferase Ste14